MNAYSDVKEKAVYLQAGDDINYLSYKWSKKDNDWNLLVEHATAEEDVLLLAVKYMKNNIEMREGFRL